MFKKTRLCFVLALMFAMSTLCCFASPVPAMAATKKILHVGETLTVTLISNPASTGYKWVCNLKDGSIVEQSSYTEENVPPSQASNNSRHIVGGSKVKQIFEFKAVNAGTVFVKFRLARTCSRCDDIAKTRVYKIVVVPQA